MKKIVGGVAILALAGLLASPALAAEFIYPKDESPEIILNRGEQHDNVYLAGMNVVVNSDTTGDLTAAGRTVVVNGAVAADLNAVGESVVVQGGVGGDARLAGASVTLNNPVAGDVLVAAGKFTVAQSAAIAKDLWVAGDGIVLSGPVSGKVRIAGGSVTINSKVSGDLQVRGVQLVFGPGSEVTGKISYKGPKPAIIQEGSKVSLASIEYTEVRAEKDRKAGLFSMAYVIKILAGLIVALVLVKLAPRRLERSSASNVASPWANLGIGLAGLIVIPILVIALLFTVLGWYLALVLLAWYILMLLIAGAAAAIFTGGLILRYGLKKPDLAVSWQGAVLGVAALAVLKIVPVLGPAAIFVLFVITFGGMLRLARQEIMANVKRGEPPAPAPQGPALA